MSLSYLSLAATGLTCGLLAYKYYKSTQFDSTAYFSKSVWVTGASSGIGKALAIALYRAGAHVILSGRSEEELQRVIREELLPLSKPGFGSGPPPPMAVAFDVAEASKNYDYALDVTRRVARASYGGTIAAVFHNAGLSMRALSALTPVETEQHLFHVNVLGPAALTKALLNQGFLSPDARIVLVSSLQGLIPLPLRAAYSASKHAAQAYFTSLRMELALMQPRLNLKGQAAGTGSSTMSVTIVSPSYVCTNLSKNALTATGAKHNKMDDTTAGGYTPEDVAHRTLCAAARRDSELWVCPMSYKIAAVLLRVCPAVIERKLMKKAEKEWLSLQ